MLVFEQTVETDYVTHELPEGGRVLVQTSGSVDVAFWNKLTGAYGTAESIAAPGGLLDCPCNRAKFTGAVTLRVIIGKH